MRPMPVAGFLSVLVHSVAVSLMSLRTCIWEPFQLGTAHCKSAKVTRARACSESGSSDSEPENSESELEDEGASCCGAARAAHALGFGNEEGPAGTTLARSDCYPRQRSA